MKFFQKALPLLACVWLLASCPDASLPRVSLNDAQSTAVSEEKDIPLAFVSARVSAMQQPVVRLDFSKTILFDKIAKDDITITEAPVPGSTESGKAITQFEIKATTPEGGPDSAFLIQIKEDLQENREYAFTVSAVEDAFGNRISVTGGFWTGSFAPIIASVPEPFTVHFIDKSLKLLFNTDLSFKPETITTATVSVCEKENPSATIELKNFSFTNTAEALNTLSFDLATCTTTDKEYELKVTDGVQTSDNKPIKPFSIVFTPSFRPIITAFNPSDTFDSFSLTVEADPAYPANPFTADTFTLTQKDSSLSITDFNYNEDTHTVSFSTTPKCAFAGDAVLTLKSITFANGAKNPERTLAFHTIKGLDDYTIGSGFADFAMSQPTYGDASEDSDYVYVFKEEFDTPHTNLIQTHDASGSKYTHNASPDPARWDVITDFRDNGWYKAEQVTVADGKCTIKAETKSGSFNKRPAKESEKYTRISGRIQTKQKFGFLYGKVFAKFKPSGKASWPALWFITNIEKYKDELDMIEYYPHNNVTDWQAVAHGGTDWNTGNWYGGNNLSTNIGNSPLYEKDITACMTWENTDNKGKSSVGIQATIDGSNYPVWGKGWRSNTADMDMGYRYLRSMYPILEIQIRGYGLGDHNETPSSNDSDRTWNNNSPTTPKLFTIDYLRIAQKKTKRFATVIDEFFSTDHYAATPGIRKAAFAYPNVEGHNYGCFSYGGQPLYETDLLVVDEKFKNQQQSLIYRVKNLRGVSLLAYFAQKIGMEKENESFSKDTGLPTRSIADYAQNPALDFTVEVAKTSQGPWVKMPFDARWSGNDNDHTDDFAAKIYEKIDVGEKQYNYVKINFPLVGSNWDKILLSKVVFTRYEGTDYNNYKIEGEV